jgi:hypothetical protein
MDQTPKTNLSSLLAHRGDSNSPPHPAEAMVSAKTQLPEFCSPGSLPVPTSRHRAIHPMSVTLNSRSSSH